MIRPPSIVAIRGKPVKGFIRPVYRGQMYRPQAAAGATMVAVPQIRVPEEERPETCAKCGFYMPAVKLAFRFELEIEKIAPDLMLCGHPNCGCWRNRERVEPWKRRFCPERKW